MKFTKMSLVATLLVGSSAFAFENTKVTGDANLFYQTTDANSGELLRAKDSSADFGVNLNVTTDVLKNESVEITAGVGYTVLSTLGVENNLVGNVWGGAHTASAGTGATYQSGLGGAKVEDANWFNEAWVAAKAGNTTAKLGRMELDTPLAFTEAWTIERNTFEAALLVNTDIPDTVIAAGFVGNGNGTESFGQNLQSNVYALGLATGGVTNGNGTFGTFGTNGAYVLGVINNSYKPLTAQLWYYDVTRVATALWLQADFAKDGILLGAQYNTMSAASANSKEDNVFALMAGYAVEDSISVKLSFSEVNDNGTLGRAGFNLATNASTSQTQLYTEAWWNYGQNTIAGTSTINLTVEAPTSIVDLGLFVTSIDHKAANSDLLEIALSASKSFGPLDTSLVFINTKVDGSDATNILQAYLTLNF